MVGIYKIQNCKNNKIYIGQSTNIEKRLKYHKSTPFNDNSPEYNKALYAAIRKYGINNFSFEIIEECTKNELNEKEKYWIKYFNSYLQGYNETEGGDAGPSLSNEQNPNHKLNESDVFDIRTRILQRESIEDIYTDYQNIISRRQFDRIRKGENWDNILTEEIKEYLSSKEYKEDIEKNRYKKYYKNKEKLWLDIEKRKNNGEDWQTVYEDYKDIYTISGFKDKWYSYTTNIKKRTGPKTPYIQQIDKQTGEILQTFTSAIEASKKTNSDVTGICKCCKGTQKTCNNFIWRYKPDD